MRHQRDKYEGGVTALVMGSSLVAAMGAFIFGYDFGMPGGVTSMKPFMNKFFPTVHERTLVLENEYCKFDNHQVTMFISSVYLVAMVVSIFASIVSKNFGRTASMTCAGVFYLLAAIINGCAANLYMLIVGRVLFGVGLGFANHATPIYLSEISPAKNRGAINIYGFQLAVTVGILISSFVNYHAAKIEGGWGWRLSLSIVAIPAVIMISGYLFLQDTPASIVERGYTEKGKEVLQRLRGTANVEREFQDIVDASEATKKRHNPWENILQRRYRPQLVLCVLIPFFQQLTGVNVVTFYAPVLFKNLGFGEEASITSASITGGVNFIATILSIYYVDSSGRRTLLREGGIQMVFCLFVLGMMIGLNFGVSGKGALSKADANIMLILICAFVAAFAWSWGPAGWLIPSEICPLEIRSAGQAIALSANMLFTFFFAQVFLTLLCQFKFGFFFFFGFFVILMTYFVILFLPETNNVPIERQTIIWKEHWFWGKFSADDTLDESGCRRPYFTTVKNRVPPNR
ncbi:hypothetical protein PTKIN_Ptkin10aG0108400 [Pterospermum kingtungense]